MGKTEAIIFQPSEDLCDAIPVVDLAPYLAGEKGALEELGAKVRHIQENIGFWTIINHGVSWDKVNAVYDQLEHFFAQPEKEKLKYKINELSLGYVPPNSTKYVSSVINNNTKKDLNETLITALERPADHPLIRAGTRFIGPNNWPSNLAGFQETIVEFQKEIRELGLKLLPVYATALGLESTFFDAYFDEPVMWTRNAHYPAVEAEENQFGIAPHSDHSFLTLLPISEVPGLQVLSQNGDWIAVDYLEKAIVVNTGEFLNRWTNGKFIATPHRVIPPKTDRYSIATFFNPSPDTLAEPLATCCDDNNPPRYDPMSLMEYLSWYIDTNYQRDAGGKQAV